MAIIKFSRPEPSRFLTVSLYGSVLVCADVMAVILSGFLSILHYYQEFPPQWPMLSSAILLSALVFHKCATLAKVYSKESLINPRRALPQVMAMLVGSMTALLVVGFWSHQLGSISRLMSLTWLIAAASLLVANRWAMATVLRRAKEQGKLRERVAIVGAGVDGVRVFEYLRAGGETELIGLFDDRHSRIVVGPGAPDYGGTVDDLLHTGRSVHLDKILVALPWSAEQRLAAICDKLKALPYVVMIAPERLGPAFIGKRVRQFAGMPWIVAADPPLLDWAVIGKTLFDKILAGIALLFLAPTLLVIAAVIKLESHGPVLFRQKRHGFNNNVITVFKFRTMHHHLCDELGTWQTEHNDPRVTRFGAFLRRRRLDELPQLLNVLRGDMSLVGPRPHPLGMLTENKLGHDIVREYALRHRMRPGITGLAQINGLCGPTVVEKQLRCRVELDLEYIDSWSMLLDLKIVALTALLFIRRGDRPVPTRGHTGTSKA